MYVNIMLHDSLFSTLHIVICSPLYILSHLLFCVVNIHNRTVNIAHQKPLKMATEAHNKTVTLINLAY